MVAWILVAHVFGIVFWVSGLLVTTIALLRHSAEPSVDARAALSRLERIFLRGMADPGALLAILAGIAVVAGNPSYYLHARWLHIKFIFVAIMIGLHVIVAINTKSFAADRITLQRGQITLLLAAIAVVFLLILIATLPGEVFLT